MGIMLTLSWSLFAAGGTATVDKINSHVARAHADQVLTGESDALVSGQRTILRPARTYNRDTADTLNYGLGWGGQFIMSPGDAMMTVFQMPADGYLKGVNVPVFEWGTGDQQLTISLHELSYPVGADGATEYPADVVDGAGWIGGYDMDATTGAVSISGTTYTPGGTASICTDGANAVADNARDPLGDVDGFGPAGIPTKGLLWPDGFTAATLDPSTTTDISNGGGDNWIATADFGSEPFVTAGTYVGILVQSTGAGGGDDDATGFEYAAGDGFVDPWASLKFYGGCSGTSGNGGWHIRHWVFNYNLAVLLTGDRPPQILDFTYLYTTVETTDRTVNATIVDDNPSGGDAGVASAILKYSTDGGTTWNDVAMTDNGDDTFTGVIPGQSAGTEVDYYIEATDVLGNVTTTSPFFYTIFQAVENRLFFYNASDYGSFISGYYLGGVDMALDFWDGHNYGPGSDLLYSNYYGVAEITGSGPSVINNDAVRTFVEGGGHYVLTGDEWLGAQTGWVNTDYVAGDFHYDILGIDADYNDINYAASGDQGGISRLMPVAGDAISGALYDFLGDSLDFNYDPNYELGFSNWLDGVDAVAGVNVAYTGYDLTLDTLGNPQGTTVYNTGIYHTHNSGANVVFLAFDPLATNTSPSYYWIGFSDLSPLAASLEWAMALGVDDPNTQLPSEFVLQGNYPNPFNPSTNIAFTMNARNNVNVTVYSLLGEKVATIHNGIMNAGSHEVTWNGLDSQGNSVASGMYIYQIAVGNDTYSGKMMLLK